MREKLWPSIVSLTHTEKLSIQILIENIGEKIEESLVSDIIIQNTNDISKHQAQILYNSLELNQVKTHEEYNSLNIQSYIHIMETLSSLIQNDLL